MEKKHDTTLSNQLHAGKMVSDQVIVQWAWGGGTDKPFTYPLISVITMLHWSKINPTFFATEPQDNQATQHDYVKPNTTNNLNNSMTKQEQGNARHTGVHHDARAIQWVYDAPLVDALNGVVPEGQVDDLV